MLMIIDSQSLVARRLILQALRLEAEPTPRQPINKRLPQTRSRVHAAGKVNILLQQR